MISLKTFKKQLGVDELEFKKSPKTGREVADVFGYTVIITKNKKFNPDEELYVTTVTEDEDGNKLEKELYVICNQGWVKGRTL